MDQRHPSKSLELRWQGLVQLISTQEVLAEEIFLELIALYSHPSRFYHTLQHIQQVLEMVEYLEANAQDLTAIQLAVWFHDAIYDPKAHDNERQSAQYGAESLTRLGVPQATIAKVQHLILQTQAHLPQADDMDSQILVDADLSILGQPELVYQAYRQAIRREYSWVSDADYRVGRTKVLQHFLARDRIYKTEGLFELLEAQARANIQSEISLLNTKLG